MCWVVAAGHWCGCQPKLVNAVAVRTQNGGKVVLKDGRVSCECCGDGEFSEDINSGDIETGAGGPSSCQCTTDPNATTGQCVDGYLPRGYRYFQIRYAVSGWVNIVSSPKVMNLYGSVVGDVKIYRYCPHDAGDPEAPSVILPFLNEIIDEGAFPCGDCVPAKNGLHIIDYTFLLAPNHYLLFDFLIGFNCPFYARLRLKSVGPYTPP